MSARDNSLADALVDSVCGCGVTLSEIDKLSKDEERRIARAQRRRALLARTRRLATPAAILAWISVTTESDEG